MRAGGQRHLVSRYSDNYPVRVLNPLTNSEILGEVYYFMVASHPPKFMQVGLCRWSCDLVAVSVTSYVQEKGTKPEGEQTIAESGLTAGGDASDYITDRSV